jgi:UPF0755 protein
MERKSFLKILLFCIAIIVLIIGSMLYLKVSISRHPLKTQNNKVQFTITSGETLNTVIDKLNKQNSIRNVYFIKLYIQKNSISQNVKPGQYSFSSNVSLEQLTRYLNKGIRDDQPGEDLEKIAVALEKKDIISKEAFIKSCREYNVPGFIKKDAKRRYILEGYLFPDTYEFLKGTDGKEIIDTMIKRFSEVINNIQLETGKNINIKYLDKIINIE